MNYFEQNLLNIKQGDYVAVRLPHCPTATIDEIAAEHIHTGEVASVYHTETGILRIEVEGLSDKLGRAWTWQNRIMSVDTKPTIFAADEPSITVSTFDIKQSFNRPQARHFRGDVTRIGAGEFEVYSCDSGNSYVVKIEEIRKHLFRVGCTCRDFTNRLRLCKHAAAVFTLDYETSKRLAA